MGRGQGPQWSSLSTSHALGRGSCKAQAGHVWKGELGPPNPFLAPRPAEAYSPEFNKTPAETPTCQVGKTQPPEHQ